MIVGLMPLYLFLGLKSFTDGLSLTKIGMYITFGGLLLNIFLNWVLIFGKLGMPALGLDGAGYATIITRWIMFFVIFYYIFTTRSLKIYTKNINLKAFYPEFYFKIWKLGLPSGSQFFFEVGAFSFCAMIVGWIGKYPLAAHQVAINLASITYMIVTGIASAGSIKVGNAMGENDNPKAKKFGAISLVLGFSFMFLSAIVFVFFGDLLIVCYTDDINVIIIAINLMFIAGIFQIADGIQAVSLGILRGLEDANIPTIITLFAYWGVGVPASYVFGIMLKMGTNGVWYGLSLGLLVSAVCLTIRFFLIVELKKSKGGGF
jgi:MATE family multidrug resistance protein